MAQSLLRRACVAGSVSVLATVAFAGPAIACGGLVGENGTIQLQRTTTLAAYHDGVERYVTSFEFSGEGESVGSIIPLPDIPSAVERGGDWTLQRLEREVAPPRDERLAFAEDSATSGAEVILTTQIDALDITILKGGGDEVGKWALDNGFFLTPDAPEVLDFYAERSPIFMAAKFDASRARALGQNTGDGTPIMLTIPTDAPWVPLRILGLGLDSDQQVDADVFLLTDEEPTLLAGGSGLTFGRNEEASPSLLSDLRSDVGMEWVPDQMWLSYLKVGAPAGDLHYDLAIAPTSDTLPALADAGITAPAARVLEPAGDDGVALWPIALGLTAGAGALVLVIAASRAAPTDGDVVKRLLGAAVVGVVAIGATGAGYAVAAAGSEPPAPLGPGLVTLEVRTDYSHFSLPAHLTVRQGTLVEFVVINDDPINHEFIIGDDEVHARHESGTEVFHPPVPGEVSVGPGRQGVTTYLFGEPGTVRYVCHLPGHAAYGMQGVITVE